MTLYSLNQFNVCFQTYVKFFFPFSYDCFLLSLLVLTLRGKGAPTCHLVRECCPTWERSKHYTGNVRFAGNIYHLDVLGHEDAGSAPRRVEIHDEGHLPLPPHQLLQFLGRHLLLQPWNEEGKINPVSDTEVGLDRADSSNVARLTAKCESSLGRIVPRGSPGRYTCRSLGRRSRLRHSVERLARDRHRGWRRGRRRGSESRHCRRGRPSGWSCGAGGRRVRGGWGRRTPAGGRRPRPWPWLGGSECGRDNPILSLPRELSLLYSRKKRRVVVCEKALNIWFSLNICLGINPDLYLKKLPSLITKFFQSAQTQHHKYWTKTNT